MRALVLLLLFGAAGCPMCSQEMEHGGAGDNADAGGSADGDASAGEPCYDAGPPPDASPYDASPYDASPYDAGAYDASPYDGGPLDAGNPCHDRDPDAGPDAGR